MASSQTPAETAAIPDEQQKPAELPETKGEEDAETAAVEAPVKAAAAVDDKDKTLEEMKAKWPGWPGYSVFRLLKPVLKVGGIIGRKGDLIKKLVEETRAGVRLLDGPITSPDRIVLISGKEEPDSALSPAMDAIIRIFKRANGLPENDGDNAIDEVPSYASSQERVVELQGEALKVLKALEGCRTKILRRCSVCCGRHFDGCGELFTEERKTDDVLRFLNYTINCSLLSTSSTMSQNFMPTFVYQRRRDHKNSGSFFETESSAAAKPSDACHSAICSEAPLLAAKEYVVSVSEHAIEGVRSPVVHPVENRKVATTSSNGFHAVEEAGSEEALTTDVDRILNDCSANDHCSSSKSNLELNSADDAGDCSSSGALIAGKEPEEISERDVCISILKSQGLLDKVWVGRTGTSNENSNNYCSKSCKVCEQTDSSKNMLICDNCDDSFHTSCYNPRITMLPVGEWLCSSCLKKKHKICKDKSTSSNFANISTESGSNRHSASELELGSLEFMLRDSEPYMSNVRIGDEFQADVPDWCGPIDEECNLIGDLLEMDTSDNTNMQDRDTIKSSKRSPIGNWLQCREVIEGVGESTDGTVCAKWRRAPLFEVQTDNWECFRCVLWDPTHADCAVPQELVTEEVMKQLKYVEMLRPRLAAKRRRSDSLKGSGSQDRSR